MTKAKTQKAPNLEHLDLTRGEKEFVLELYRRTENGQKGAFVSNAELGDALNKSISSVNNFIRKLKDKNIVITRNEFDATDGKKIRCIFLNIESPTKKTKRSTSKASKKSKRSAKSSAKTAVTVSDTGSETAKVENKEAQSETVASAMARLDKSTRSYKTADFKSVCFLPRAGLLPGEYEEKVQPEQVTKMWPHYIECGQYRSLVANKDKPDFFALRTLYYSLAHSRPKLMLMLCKNDIIANGTYKEMPDNGEWCVAVGCSDKTRENERKIALRAAKQALFKERTCSRGLDLLPENLKVSVDGEEYTLPRGIWEYMRANKIGVFANSRFSVPFKSIFETMRNMPALVLQEGNLNAVWLKRESRLHVEAAKLPAYMSNALNQSISVCRYFAADKELSFVSTKKIADEPENTPENSPNTALKKVYLSALFGVKVALFDAKNTCISTIFSGLNKRFVNLPKIVKPVGARINTGVRPTSAELSSVLNYIYIYNIYYYYITTSIPTFHTGLLQYDFRELAKLYPWGRYFKDHQLMFDFSSFRIDLNSLTPEQARNPSTYSLSFHQLMQFIWFEICYRIFLMPELQIFENLWGLSSKGDNFLEWFDGPQGLSNGLIRESLAISSGGMRHFVSQFKETFKPESKNARRFVLQGVCRLVADVCADLLDSHAVRDVYQRDYRQDLRAMIYDICTEIDNFNNDIVANSVYQPSNERGRIYSPTAEQVLESLPPVFENPDNVTHVVSMTGPGLLLLKRRMLYRLAQNLESSAHRWRTDPFDRNPVTFLKALVSREKDRAHFDTLTKSYFHEEISFDDI